MVMLMAVAVAIVVMVVLVVMLMAVAVAIVVMVVLMVVLVAVAVAIVVMVVLMVMLMAAAGAMIVVLMMMVMQFDVQLDGTAGFNDLQHHVGLEIIPRGGDDTYAGMRLFDEDAALLDAVGAEHLGAAEDDGIGSLDLIKEELAEVLHMHAALACIHNRRAAADFHFGMLVAALFHCGDDLAQLAHAGGLDNQTVGLVLVDQLVHSLLEIAHKGAADAAGVQLVHDDAGVLHEGAVHAHVAVFILQQDNFFALDFALQQLLDEGCLARAKEAGNNVDLDHAHISISIMSVG